MAGTFLLTQSFNLLWAGGGGWGDVFLSATASSWHRGIVIQAQVGWKASQRCRGGHLGNGALNRLCWMNREGSYQRTGLPWELCANEVMQHVAIVTCWYDVFQIYVDLVTGILFLPIEEWHSCCGVIAMCFPNWWKMIKNQTAFQSSHCVLQCACLAWDSESVHVLGDTCSCPSRPLDISFIMPQHPLISEEKLKTILIPNPLWLGFAVKIIRFIYSNFQKLCNDCA